MRDALAADGTSLLWGNLRWAVKDLWALSTRLAVEDGAAALGRPRDGEGLAVGKPRDEEGKLGSETADGKLLMCLMFTRSREKW